MPQRIPINYIKLYKRGQYATYNGSTYVVDHVTLRGHELLVHFKDEDRLGAVNARLVDVEVTAIDFNRNNSEPGTNVQQPEKPVDEVPDQFDDDDLLKDFLG